MSSYCQRGGEDGETSFRSGDRVVAGLVENLAAHLDDGGAVVAELFEQLEVGGVIRVALAGEEELELLRVAGGVLQMDEARQRQQRLEAIGEWDARELEVAVVVGGFDRRAVRLPDEPEQALRRVDRAADMRLDCERQLAGRGDGGPRLQALDHAVLHAVPLRRFATEHGFGNRLLEREVLGKLRGGFDGVEVLRVRFVVCRQAQVEHQRGDIEPRRREPAAKVLARIGGERLRLGWEARIEGEFDVAVAGLRAHAQRFVHRQRLHAVEAEAETDARAGGARCWRESGERGGGGGVLKELAAGLHEVVSQLGGQFFFRSARRSKQSSWRSLRT